ncbi:MAG: TetR family transcriptional regulator C-terminal domain-containing protein [Gammaproteobacteria bacterium]|nr:TetR family transcriptional regulator C-terminal domain-containing protein [Gammaproteobacteria bacterium]MDE2262550.1 TetR family transcriptional regulator C-terminal domain-containing protein [Gammaproteobacteria bacterium]
MAREQQPKFRRAPPTVRREALIEATLACLRKYGHDGLSVRRIGAEAGVSAGLITHHFPSVSALIAASYETLSLSLLQSIDRQARESGTTARERLRRFYEAWFAPALLDPGIFNAWLVFWSMISHDAAMRAVHDRTYAAYRAALESLLRQLHRSEGVPRFRLRPAAIALSALLDGLWIEASINPRTFKAAEAVALCEDWTSALCAGAFPGLLLAPRPATRRRRPRQPRESPVIPA